MTKKRHYFDPRTTVRKLHYFQEECYGCETAGLFYSVQIKTNSTIAHHIKDIVCLHALTSTRLVLKITFPNYTFAQTLNIND